MKRISFVIILVLVIPFQLSLFAWVYPEHREISLISIKELPPNYRIKLDSLWSSARINFENRLSFNVIEPYQYRNPKYLDYAAWAAIAGDHSCSPKDMLDVILGSDWILGVADIAAKLKIDLLAVGLKEARMTDNALRDADILIQKTDPGYATRAGTNNVHFLLSLNDVNTDLNKYLAKCIEKGAELNGIAAYTWFHYNALIMAFKYFSEDLNSKEKSELILNALAHEAFALHFLQDMFAAGHVAGTWGDASQRKGTHDYYNEKGLKAITWEGENIIITGDAYMRSQDAKRASEAVGISLRQFIDAAYGIYDETIFTDERTLRKSNELNVCENNILPQGEFSRKFLELEKEILLKTPRPGLVSGLGELPRFRAELGLFTGFSPSLNGTLISGGFGASQETIGAVGGIEAAVRIGFGLDGVLNESGDGLIFLGFGWKEDGASSIGVIDQEGTQKYGNLLAAVPGRSAFSFRLRVPFYLLPADMILVGPILMVISPESLAHMAVIAANGGLIPWHSGIATPFGRFQFVLGREISAYLYGRSRERDAVLFIDQDERGDLISGILSYRSTKIEFPILEYRPFRSFSFDQSSGLLFQLFGGVDIPHNVAVLDPLGVQKPKLKNIWYGGIRLVFDWRHYF